MQSEYKAQKATNEKQTVELIACQKDMKGLTAELRKVAGELRAVNREREALLAANCTLKRARHDEELKLKARSDTILTAQRELQELERTLTQFNQSCLFK